MKVIREVYLYSETHLPVNGWLQGCWECDIITSKTKKYKTINTVKRIYKFIIYLCPSCKKQTVKTDKIDEFNTRCNEFIIDYLARRS